MNDQLERAVRSVLTDIISTAPARDAQAIRTVGVEPSPRTGHPYLKVAAAMLAVVGVGGVALLSSRDPGTTPTAARTGAEITSVPPPAATALPPTVPTAPGPSPVTVTANNAVVAPTLLTSSNLPSGMTLEDGGTTTIPGPAEVELVASDNSVSYRIQWQPADCISAAVPPRTDALAALAAQQVAAGEQPIDPFVQWCDGPNFVTVYSTGSTPESFVAFVSTVSAASDSSSVTFVPPSGMQYRSEPVTRTWSALSYRNGDRVILIKVASAVDGEIPLSLADVSKEQAIIVGPFTAHRTVDQPSPQLLLVYDDNTVAFISGENVTDQELEDAAAALRPADTTLAPPVSGNCKTFGAMCG